MNQTLRRVFIMLCAGAGVWVLVFWLYEPAGPNVTYGGAPAGVRGGGSTLAQVDTVEGPDADSLDPTLSRREFEPEPVQPQAAPVTPAAATTNPNPAAPNGAGDTATTFAPRVVAPEFWEYTVQRGDNSWESIAEKTLGDRKLASAVLRANPLVSPDKLIPGRTRLKIPRDPKNIQGKVVNEPVAPPPASSPPAGTPAATEPTKTEPAETKQPEVKPTPAATPADAAPPAAQRTHTVAKGDTLSQIAQTYLGSTAKWREIYQLNKSVIPDPDHLKLGTVLKIPATKP